MSGEIRMSDAATEAVAARLRQELSDYGSFELMRLCGSMPGAAGADHDGRIAALLRGALSSFVGVVQGDASMVGGLGSAIAATDAGVASKILAR